MTTKKRRCKCCYQLSEKLRDMSRYEKQLNMSIKASFTVMTSIDADDNDRICQKCLKTLIRCGKFLEVCEQSELKRLNILQHGDQEEIEERIEGESGTNSAKDDKNVTFDDPIEEVYESDFEDVASEPTPSEEIGTRELSIKEDDCSDIQIEPNPVKQHFCTVCRLNFPNRSALEAHYKGSTVYCQTFIISTT